MQLVVEIGAWIAVVAFFVFFYWYMCQRQAADPGSRGEHAGGLQRLRHR
ncbi:MAG: hypothetical protein L0211_26970 [Planctomycetaceae bacterium]|nr:hypothetical protein [Planctomycetaceae bacterium]